MMVDVVQQVGAQGGDARLAEDFFALEDEPPTSHGGLFSQGAEQLFGGASILLESSADLFHAFDRRGRRSSGRKLISLDDPFRHGGNIGHVPSQLAQRS